MTRWSKALVILEVLVCLGPSAVLLLLGLAVAPMQVYYIFTMPPEVIPGALYVIGSVLAGLLGLGALVYVVWHLFADRPIRRPILVFTAVFVALLALAPHALFSDSIGYRIVMALPFACSAHILYLSRRLFVRSPQKQLRA